MQQDKVKVKLSGIPASMLFPLWGRAQLGKEYSSLFYDAKAVELVERIDFDLAASDMPFMGILSHVFRKGNLPPAFGLVAIMAKLFDDKINTFITEHPRASVVNIGSGLDATFYRVDNGLIHWYDLDLPAGIEVRKQLLPEPDRVTYIAKSLLDPSWCKDINTENGVFMMAQAVFQFFEESEMKQFFSMLADNFPGGEIVFTAMSRLDGGFREWMDMFPPEQRDAMRASLVEALKDWWEKAPQDQKNKVNDAIATLKTPTKPKGAEWSDLEAWWTRLSDTEKEEALRDLMAAFWGRVGMWALEDANEIAKWDNRITVIDQGSLLKNIPRDSLSADMRRVIDYSEQSRGFNVFHLRV
jgi:O-methyltransferase involved in polyketide biosynthesis